jgi:hypothetical protein
MERFMQKLQYPLYGTLYARTTVPNLWNTLFKNCSTHFMELFMQELQYPLYGTLDARTTVPIYGTLYA